MVFAKAGPAEILRAAQKDDLIAKTLKGIITDIILRTAGTRTAIFYKPIIEAISYFIYYGNTTLSGLQTLGEEYTGIIQVDSSLRSLPSFLSRLVMLILDCFGAIITLKSLSLLEKKIQNNDQLHPRAKSHILEFLTIIKAILPFMNHIHKAFFYCTGGTYHLAKRLTGINYVLMRSWLKDRESLFGFRLLGIITSVHLATLGIHSALNWFKNRSEKNDFKELVEPKTNTLSRKEKCSLCLESLISPSLSPCGHLFCWICIHDWLQNQPRCPVCRENIRPSRIILLRNYA